MRDVLAEPCCVPVGDVVSDTRVNQLRWLLDGASDLAAELDAELPNTFSLLRYDLGKLKATLASANTITQRIGARL